MTRIIALAATRISFRGSRFEFQRAWVETDAQPGQEPSPLGQLGSKTKGYLMSRKMPNTEADVGRQVPPRRHDAGSGANETTDGLDASTEALRHAAEDTPSGATPEDIEVVPVFDRA
jgi:hypothetical protein